MIRSMILMACEIGLSVFAFGLVFGVASAGLINAALRAAVGN
jgi:hypothetical protein